MGFFHKIKIIILRALGRSIPAPSQSKDYSSKGEINLAQLIKDELPQCRVKRNIIISTADGNAEIDCLVLYKSKLFAIELKSWKGAITERENAFVQYKIDKWTGEVYSKKLKSPFKQLSRAIHLLHKQIRSKTWVNAVVFFEAADSVDAQSDIAWFCDVKKLISYIRNGGEDSPASEADALFSRCICADTLISVKKDRSLQCAVMGESLRFKTRQGEITRKDISRIKVTHHSSYDDLKIELTDGSYRRIKREHHKLRTWSNGYYKNYPLCKLEIIELGREI